MRKIEKEMIEAIKARKDFTGENTTVWVWGENRGFGLVKVKVLLHGNLIATISDNELCISDCGHRTKITKSRLNCILNHFNLPTITQQKNQWYIEDGKYIWYGSKTFDISKKETEPQPREFDAVLGGQSQQPRSYDAVLGGKR